MATILIVDDRSINREFLVTLLAYDGHRLLEAADGAAALDVVHAEHPDLVITDILMPKMDGYAFVQTLRAGAACANLPVIFYTATYREPEARQLAAACGVDQVLMKPSQPEEIFAAIRAALHTDKQAAPASQAAEALYRQHLRVLTDKLAEKVDELEGLNAALERRVDERTEELRVANNRLTEVNHLKDQLILVLSHDLRSPLSAIEMQADLLREMGDAVAVPARDEFLHGIAAGARHLTALVNNLLDLAKMDAGKFQLDLADMQLSEVTRQVVEVMRFNATAKQITLQVTIASDDPILRGDRLKLAQVVTNLLGNAIKYTQRGGTITLAVQQIGAGVQLTVTDNGPGIAPEFLPHLFERFTEGGARATGGEASTGLGLAIVRQLVELHGGTVSVDSEIGRGSTFTVIIPMEVSNGDHSGD